MWWLFSFLCMPPQCWEKVQDFCVLNAWDCHLSSRIHHPSIILLTTSLHGAGRCSQLVCGSVKWLSKPINLALRYLGFRFPRCKTRAQRRPDLILNMLWICINWVLRVPLSVSNMFIRFQKLTSHASPPVPQLCRIPWIILCGCPVLCPLDFDLDIE